MPGEPSESRSDDMGREENQAIEDGLRDAQKLAQQVAEAAKAVTPEAAKEKQEIKNPQFDLREMFGFKGKFNGGRIGRKIDPETIHGETSEAKAERMALRKYVEERVAAGEGDKKEVLQKIADEYLAWEESVRQGSAPETTTDVPVATPTRENIPVAQPALPSPETATPEPTPESTPTEPEKAPEVIAASPTKGDKPDFVLTEKDVLEDIEPSIENISPASKSASGKQENKFYSELHIENDINIEAKEATKKEAGKRYYKNTKEYQKAIKPRVERKMLEEEGSAAIQARWDLMTAEERQEYGNEIEVFKKIFIEKLGEKQAELRDKGFQVPKEALFGFIKAGYNIEDLSIGLFGYGNVKLHKSQLKKEDEGNVVEYEEVKMSQKDFKKWVETMQAYEEKIIKDKVKAEIERKTEEGTKRFKDMTAENKKDVLEKAFEARIFNANDFIELYVVLREKGVIVGADENAYEANSIIKTIAKCKKAVLDGSTSADKVNELLMTNNKWNGALNKKIYELLRLEEIEQKKQKEAKEEIEPHNEEVEVEQSKLADQKFKELTNPPIEGKFDPESIYTEKERLPVDKKKTTPEERVKNKEERKKFREEYKEKLLIQQEALADCRLFIEEEIEKNQDVDKEVLLEWVNRFAEKYAFTEKQISKAIKLIEKYYEKRQAAQNLLKKYGGGTKNVKELIKELTGEDLSDEELKGIEEIYVDKISIVIEANNGVTRKLWSEDSISASDVGAFANTNREIPFIVINREGTVSKKANDPYLEKLRKHETQHTKDALFREVLKEEDLKMLAAEIDKNEYLTDEQKLSEKLRLLRRRLFNKVKSEIFSSLYDIGIKGLEKSIKARMFLEGKYDYRASLGGNKLYEKDAKASQEIFEKEYGTIIKQAVTSLAKLMKQGEYSKEKAIAVLTDKPLEFWKANIDRIIERSAQGLPVAELAEEEYEEAKEATDTDEVVDVVLGDMENKTFEKVGLIPTENIFDVVATDVQKEKLKKLLKERKSLSERIEEMGKDGIAIHEMLEFDRLNREFKQVEKEIEKLKKEIENK